MQKTKTVYIVEEWQPSWLSPVRIAFETKKAAQEYAEGDYRSLHSRWVFRINHESKSPLDEVKIYRTAQGAETDSDYFFIYRKGRF